MMKVVVEKTDGHKATYPILPKTQVAFERQFNVGLGALATDSRLEYIYWLAWHAEKSAGVVVKLFDDWLEEVASVEPGDELLPLEPPSLSPTV